MVTRSLSSSGTGTLYFGYGSNLSPFQMSGRCPSSGVPVAIARLNSWMWIITERGYANVIPVRPARTSTDTDASSVWGLLYNLTPEDEATLDMYEGWSEVGGHAHERGPENPQQNEHYWKPYEQGKAEYNKMYLSVKIEKWLIPDPKATLGIDESELASSISRCLVYASEQHLIPGRIRQSYVRRMGRAARECISLGVPETWIINCFSQHGIDKNDPDSFHDDIRAGPMWVEPPRQEWETIRRNFLQDEVQGHEKDSS